MSGRARSKSPAGLRRRNPNAVTIKEGNNISYAAKKDLRKLFNEIDGDSSGYIDANELFQATSKAFPNLNLTQIDVQGMMEEADLNNDGLIDFDEFCIMMDKSKKNSALWDKMKDSFIHRMRDNTRQTIQVLGAVTAPMHNFSRSHSTTEGNRQLATPGLRITSYLVTFMIVMGMYICLAFTHFGASVIVNPDLEKYNYGGYILKEQLHHLQEQEHMFEMPKMFAGMSAEAAEQQHAIEDKEFLNAGEVSRLRIQLTQADGHIRRLKTDLDNAEKENSQLNLEITAKRSEYQKQFGEAEKVVRSATKEKNQAKADKEAKMQEIQSLLEEKQDARKEYADLDTKYKVCRDKEDARTALDVKKNQEEMRRSQEEKYTNDSIQNIAQIDTGLPSLFRVLVVVSVLLAIFSFYLLFHGQNLPYFVFGLQVQSANGKTLGFMKNFFIEVLSIIGMAFFGVEFFALLLTGKSLTELLFGYNVVVLGKKIQVKRFE